MMKRNVPYALDPVRIPSKWWRCLCTTEVVAPKKLYVFSGVPWPFVFDEVLSVVALFFESYCQKRE
jgi:hypothetical protein